jgi:hypothetical protein
MMTTMISTTQSPVRKNPWAPMANEGRDVVVVEEGGEGGEEMAVEMPLCLRRLRLSNRR